MARPHLGSGELVPLLEDWALDPMPLYVAYPPNRHVSAKARVFIDWVAALMAKHAPPARPQPSTHCAPGLALRPAPPGPPAP